MIRKLMNKIRKAVIPAAGPRLALAFALPTIRVKRRGRHATLRRSAAHAAALTGRAVFKVYSELEGYCE